MRRTVTRSRIAGIGGALLLALPIVLPVALSASHAADPDPHGGWIQRELEREEQFLGYRLDRLQGLAGARRQSEIARQRTARELSITEQKLNTLKTREPNDREQVPVLERQLDRVQRGAAPRNPLLRAPTLSRPY